MSTLLTDELLVGKPAINPEQLQTAHRRARVLQGMLVIYLALLVLTNVWYVAMPASVTLAPEIAITVWFLVTGVAFMWWTSAAYRLVPAFTGHPTERTPGWAAWGYVVPIMSLWVPYQIMREIADAADPDEFDAGLGRFESSPPIELWWGVWLTWEVLAQVLNRIPEEDFVATGLTFPTVLALVVTVLILAATVLAFVVVRRVDADQQAVAALRAQV